MNYLHLHPTKKLLVKSLLLAIVAACFACVNKDAVGQTKTVVLQDTTVTKPVAELPGYDSLQLTSTQSITAAEGTKSVLFNTAGTKLYAMNLEGMSVYEFDASTKKITREFLFKPTRGTGWDYVREKPVASFQEKPVEACFSNDDKFLWVSLHNADGIVPLPVDSAAAATMRTDSDSSSYKKKKKMYVKVPGKKGKDSLYVPLIITGKTPKVIARTANSSHLLVSNWHSYNVSILNVDEHAYPYASIVKNIPVTAIPRGIVVDDKNNRSYVAIMGSASLATLNNTDWTKEKDIAVASNPRHVVMDDSARIFVSYNKLAKVACIDAVTGKTLFTAKTAAQPRTIMLSKNKKFLIVTCYSGNTVEVFKIDDNKFTKKYTLPCKGKPVGVDIRETDDTLEAWVCNYVGGNIKIFSFKKFDSLKQ